MKTLQPEIKNVTKMGNVTRYTRVRGGVRKIYCPLCHVGYDVGHLCWSASACPNCGKWINKTEYKVED